MFGGLEDWWRIVTRCDRRPKVFLSAIASDATVIHWPWDAVTGRTQLERCHLPDSARAVALSRIELPRRMTG